MECLLFMRGFLLIMILASSNIADASGRSYLDLGIGYKTGDFGTDTKSTLSYLHSSIGYIAPKYDFSVSVPYQILSNKTLDQNQTERGISDIILTAGSILIPDENNRFSLDGRLVLKLAIESDNLNLGSSETDYGAILGISKQIQKLKLRLTGGFVKVGDPLGINYNDIYFLGFALSKLYDKTNFAVSFDTRRSIIAETPNFQELSLSIYHTINANVLIRSSVMKGLSNSGPELGLDFGIINWFE